MSLTSSNAHFSFSSVQLQFLFVQYFCAFACICVVRIHNRAIKRCFFFVFFILRSIRLFKLPTIESPMVVEFNIFFVFFLCQTIEYISIHSSCNEHNDKINVCLFSVLKDVSKNHVHYYKLDTKSICNQKKKKTTNTPTKSVKVSSISYE